MQRELSHPVEKPHLGRLYLVLSVVTHDVNWPINWNSCLAIYSSSSFTTTDLLSICKPDLLWPSVSLMFPLTVTCDQNSKLFRLHKEQVQLPPLKAAIHLPWYRIQRCLFSTTVCCRSCSEAKRMTSLANKTDLIFNSLYHRTQAFPDTRIPWNVKRSAGKIHPL